MGTYDQFLVNKQGPPRICPKKHEGVSVAKIWWWRITKEHIISFHLTPCLLWLDKYWASTSSSHFEFVSPRDKKGTTTNHHPRDMSKRGTRVPALAPPRRSRLFMDNYIQPVLWNKCTIPSTIKKLSIYYYGSTRYISCDYTWRSLSVVLFYLL